MCVSNRWRQSCIVVCDVNCVSVCLSDTGIQLSWLCWTTLHTPGPGQLEMTSIAYTGPGSTHLPHLAPDQLATRVAVHSGPHCEAPAIAP